MPRYRRNVCIAVRQPATGLLLLCHRKGFPKEEGWQFPQGGIRDMGDLISEMKRELLEEIGTDDVAVVRVSSREYSYTFPEHARKSRPQYDGQVQQWVLAELKGDESDIRFTHSPAEFDAFMWATPEAVLERIVDFKKQVYREAMADLGITGPDGQIKNTQ
jgi:putative (di)nucleoside polyphosphate hydrolase